MLIELQVKGILCTKSNTNPQVSSDVFSPASCVYTKMAPRITYCRGQRFQKYSFNLPTMQACVASWAPTTKI